MDILYLLIPMSAVAVLGILGVFAWALGNGQFDDIEPQAARILQADGDALDVRQAAAAPAVEESPRRHDLS